MRCFVIEYFSPFSSFYFQVTMIIADQKMVFNILANGLKNKFQMMRWGQFKILI